LIAPILALNLSYPEHLGTTYRAYALSRRLAILHGYGLSIPHFSIGLTVYAVC